MIQIKRNNKVFFTLEDFGEGSKLSYQLMDHHYIILKFTTATPVYFEIGDSVEIPDFGYYELTSAYFPKHNDSDGYDYEMQMDAYYMVWKNKLCKYRPQNGANETSFKLTTTVGVHMNVIIGNLKALGLTYNGKEFSVDYTTYNNKAFDVQKRFLIEYGSISILDALNAICSEDALNCEWWIDGSIIYLGYCEMEGQTTFEQNVNVLSMSYSESKSTYITRLYAFGSDRNIPKGYFTGADADVTTDGVATDYLMLPNKEVDSDGFYAKDGYLENVNVVKNDKQAIEGVVMFEDEYPKVECRVSRIKTYESTVENDDGTKTTQTFWQVGSTDSFAESFEVSWIKRNLTPGIKFTSGSLMGMEFDVNFKIIDKVNYFEIVANDTYGRTLPDGVICPKVGDKFFLFNWDATKITDTDLIPTAQLALFDRAKQYYQKTMISNSNFTCTMDGDKFYNKGIYDYHPIGEQVKLINDMFAQVDANGKHYRNSRIIGMEIPLDIPYDHPQYIVGEKAVTSRLGKLEDKIDSIKVNGMQIGGTGSGNGRGVYVIGTNDTTPASDSNVYSARRSIKEFLSKFKDDTAQGLITFLKGLKAQDVIKAVNGMSLGNGESYVNGNGDAKLTDVVVDRIHDKNSTPSDRVIIGAQGFDLYMGDDGKSHLFVDYLTARTRMFASSVEIRKVSYSGGTTIFSNAGSQIAKVSYIYDAAKEKVIAYKCYAVADDGTTKTMNWWHVGMMALCQTFNVKEGESENLSNRYYWRMVVGVGQEKIDGKLYDYVVLSNLQTFHGNDNVIPYSNTGAQFGNGFPIAFGATLVSTTGDMEMKSLAYIFQDQEGKTTDDSNTAIADRVFYGYETVDGDREPDAPQAYDVIVQAGDQIEWKKYGNVIKLSTSTEDNATDNAPAITMYHKMGAPNATGDTDENGNPVINPYLWRTVTAVISPEIVMYNTDIYKLFQSTPDNIVDPIVVIFDIIPSAQYITRHPVSRTTTPSNITFRVRRRTGNAVDYIDNAKIYACINGSEEGTLLSTKQLSDLGTIYDMNSVSLYATVNAVEAGKPYDKRVAELDIPVLTDGENGTEGKSALNIVIKGAPLVFDTDDNGLVADNATQSAQIYVYQKGVNVSDLCKNIRVVPDTCVNCSATAAFFTNYILVVVKDIAKDSFTTSEGTDYISKTSGYAVVQFSYDGVMYQQQVAFNVNVSKFSHSVVSTNKEYKQNFTELNKTINGLQDEVNDIPIRTADQLTQFESNIIQNSRQISLELTEQAVSRRNLLVNSDFARNGGFALSTPSKAIVERLSGYDGSNCIHTFTSSTSFPTLRWEDYSSKTNNIPIVGGEKYTISCWAKVSNTAAQLYIKVFGQKAITGNIESSTVATGTLLDEVVTLNSANVWQLVSFTFVASGGYSYCSVRLFYSLETNGRIDGYVCRPMFEQSDSYNGWTLSEEDYDYRGGNMLDNTRYLNTGGNLAQVGKVTSNAIDGCSMSEGTVKQGASVTLVRFNNVSVKADNDYTLSFLVRSYNSSSKTNVECTLNLLTNVKFAECSNGSVSNFTSANGNSKTSGYVQLDNIPTAWTKVWYHFSPKNTVTNQAIAIQVYGRNGAGTLQICQPKLEAGLMNTPWTEATEDVANKDALKRTGIDIEKGKITLNADNTVITGDLHLKGILIENSAEISYNLYQPIICDMVHHKSVTFRTWAKENNKATWLSGININPYVVLPMINDVALSATDQHGELTVHGIKESGMKLTISSQYNPLVAKWATGKKYQYNDRYSMENQTGKPYEFLHRAVVVVFADPRLASVNNYNASNTGRIHPQGGGVPPFFGDAKYDGGCFICNGRRSRMLFLMPGQSLHLASSIERIGNSDVVVWYIDNSNDFAPISKTVTIYAQYVNGGDGYNWGGENEDKSFPDDRLNGSVGYRYEDVLLAPPQLSATYPEKLPTEAGTNSVSEVPFEFNIY